VKIVTTGNVPHSTNYRIAQMILTGEKLYLGNLRSLVEVFVRFVAPEGILFFFPPGLKTATFPPVKPLFHPLNHFSVPYVIFNPLYLNVLPRKPFTLANFPFFTVFGNFLSFKTSQARS